MEREPRYLLAPAACLLLAVAVAHGGDASGYSRFDPDLPGEKPRQFAAKVFATDKAYVAYQAFDDDGKLYYAATDREWTASALYERTADHGAQPRKLELLPSKWQGEPFFHSGRLYFTAILPPGDKPWHSDLYVAERNGHGWGAPKALPAPINTESSEWHLSATTDGVVYFCSERDGGRLRGDIFRGVPVGGGCRIEKLPEAVNTDANDCDPLIAPDESWLIFHSDRAGGFGAHDLYVSFRDRSGRWSQAANMGPEVNTAEWEMAPSLTPDGRFLLFARRKAFVTDEPSRIWWVSVQVVERLRQAGTKRVQVRSR